MNIEKNRKIAQSKKATREKRESQVCRVFQCKIQRNKLTARQKEELKMLFVEGKWCYNAILNFGESSSIFDYDTKSKTVVHKDKDGNDITSEYAYLPQSLRQTIHTQIKNSIRVLAVRKRKGLKVGPLKYISELKALEFKQYGVTHKIPRMNRMKLQGIKGLIKVNGMDQFLDNPDYEIANVKLLNRPDGYYIAVTCWIDKDKVESKQKNNKVIGVDFGIETDFTTSDGEKIHAAVQEGERIKRFQKKLARQVKGSRRYARTLHLIRVEYQKMTNCKDDLANKIVAGLVKNRTVVIQDEMLTHWHRGWFAGHVQHSVLGRVKSDLIMRDDVVVLNKRVPSTKFCPHCGNLNSLSLKDRVYRCDCGADEMDRDVHAARNMVWFYENNVGVGRTETSAPEIRRAIEKAFMKGNLGCHGPLKGEASTF